MLGQTVGKLWSVSRFVCWIITYIKYFEYTLCTVYCRRQGKKYIHKHYSSWTTDQKKRKIPWDSNRVCSNREGFTEGVYLRQLGQRHRHRMIIHLFELKKKSVYHQDAYKEEPQPGLKQTHIYTYIIYIYVYVLYIYNPCLHSRHWHFPTSMKT